MTKGNIEKKPDYASRATYRDLNATQADEIYTAFQAKTHSEDGRKLTLQERREAVGDQFGVKYGTVKTVSRHQGKDSSHLRSVSQLSDDDIANARQRYQNSDESVDTILGDLNLTARAFYSGVLDGFDYRRSDDKLRLSKMAKARQIANGYTTSPADIDDVVDSDSQSTLQRAHKAWGMSKSTIRCPGDHPGDDDVVLPQDVPLEAVVGEAHPVYAGGRVPDKLSSSRFPCGVRTPEVTMRTPEGPRAEIGDTPPGDRPGLSESDVSASLYGSPASDGSAPAERPDTSESSVAASSDTLPEITTSPSSLYQRVKDWCRRNVVKVTAVAAIAGIMAGSFLTEYARARPAALARDKALAAYGQAQGDLIDSQVMLSETSAALGTARSDIDAINAQIAGAGHNNLLALLGAYGKRGADLEIAQQTIDSNQSLIAGTGHETLAALIDAYGKRGSELKGAYSSLRTARQETIKALESRAELQTANNTFQAEDADLDSKLNPVPLQTTPDQLTQLQLLDSLGNELESSTRDLAQIQVDTGKRGKQTVRLNFMRDIPALGYGDDIGVAPGDTVLDLITNSGHEISAMTSNIGNLAQGAENVPDVEPGFGTGYFAGKMSVTNPSVPAEAFALALTNLADSNIIDSKYLDQAAGVLSVVDQTLIDYRDKDGIITHLIGNRQTIEETFEDHSRGPVRFVKHGIQNLGHNLAAIARGPFSRLGRGRGE
ncbi:MAG: hypothetical protein V1740_00890 [Candidatus Woesearchaeota archaeon]